MKSIFLILVLIGGPVAGCKQESQSVYFKAMTRKYVAFFGKGSWWEYAVEGYADLQQWVALSSISGMTDNSTMGGKGRYAMFSASLGTLPDMGYSLCTYRAVAAEGKDRITTGDYFSYTITATDTTITGDGALPLENQVLVNGHVYNEVLHLVNSSSYYREVWIALYVGMIRMLREDGRVLYLKNFKIENL